MVFITLIQVEIRRKMMILQQVEIVNFMPYCRSIATRTLRLLHKYKAHIKGREVCFRDVQVKNNVRITNL